MCTGALRRIFMNKPFEPRTPEDIAEHLKELHFKKKLVGGVDELQVWEAINSLNDYYAQIYRIQEVQNEALLAERDKTLRQYQQILSKYRKS